MSRDRQPNAAQAEQRDRRRLMRLIGALPVFSGITSSDGHLLRTQPETAEAFLWTLPQFNYSHDSITAVIEACDRAAKGERVQVERPYAKTAALGQTPDLARGLLTLTPITDDDGFVEELGVTLIDCDDAGVPPPDPRAPIRLAQINARIDTMLGLSQTVIETLLALHTDAEGGSPRDAIARRLDVLGRLIDPVSDPDVKSLPLRGLVELAMGAACTAVPQARTRLALGDTPVPLGLAPALSLLVFELARNARQHGAWSGDHGQLRIEAEVLDGAAGRTLRLHWMEDGGPTVPDTLLPAFGLRYARELFPVLTGGETVLLNTPEGLSWTFALPLPDTDDEPRFGQYEGGFGSDDDPDDAA